LGSGGPRRVTAAPGWLPQRQKIDMSPGVEKLSGDPACRPFVLQDRKRLPARFFAFIAGAESCRAA